MDIHANIENMRYTPTLCKSLKTYEINDFISGKAFGDATFNLSYNENNIGVSWWVSPKRTRSYPYARVYDTMEKQVRVTIIPFVKDEGKDGDRDFVQWDTVSLMSLLGVYVILAYYRDAQKNKRYENKITAQRLDYEYLKTRIDELLHYKSDALHWNLWEMNEHLLKTAQKCKQHYQNISTKTGVLMHSVEGIDRRIDILKKDVELFKATSRNLAISAQHREYQTTQPKEVVIDSKAKITIENYLGGMYYFTIDEAVLANEKLFLVEKKHSSRLLIPSLGDIKDGFVKMMLFTNLSEVRINEIQRKHHSVLGLTSNKLNGYCFNTCNHFSTCPVNKCMMNRFRSILSPKASSNLKEIFTEGLRNNFLVFLMGTNVDYQDFISDSLPRIVTGE